VRKTLTTLIIAALAASAGRAEAQLPPLRLGVLGGVAFATLTGDADDADYRTSPTFGAVIVLGGPGHSWGFESGAVYAPKGAETSIGIFDGTLQINYIEVPLLARYSLDLAGTDITPAVTFGGALAFQISCDITAETGGLTVAADCEDEGFAGVASFKTIDFGWSIGGEVEIPVGQGTIVSPIIRYTRGLIDIPEESNLDVKNSVIQIGFIVRVAP
jgi:hypothetical protein